METASTKTILVVEDEAAIRRALVAKLQHEGYAVLEADDGQVGLRLALEHHPDLILLDLLMPKMTGVAVIVNLQKDSWGKNVPIIILSNFSSGELFNKVMQMKKYTYLIKSDTPMQDVMDAVHKAL